MCFKPHYFGPCLFLLMRLVVNCGCYVEGSRYVTWSSVRPSIGSSLFSSFSTLSSSPPNTMDNRSFSQTFYVRLILSLSLSLSLSLFTASATAVFSHSLVVWLRAGSNLTHSRYVPTSTQRAISTGSVNPSTPTVATWVQP